MAPQALAERGKGEMMEEGRFGGACMDANLLHMVEMAFQCKMWFSSCVPPALMMINLSMPPPPFCLCLFFSVAAGQRNS